jgi:hypothetical protein
MHSYTHTPIHPYTHTHKGSGNWGLSVYTHTLIHTYTYTGIGNWGLSVYTHTLIHSYTYTGSGNWGLSVLEGLQARMGDKQGDKVTFVQGCSGTIPVGHCGEQATLPAAVTAAATAAATVLVLGLAVNDHCTHTPPNTALIHHHTLHSYR